MTYEALNPFWCLLFCSAQKEAAAAHLMVAAAEETVSTLHTTLHAAHARANTHAARDVSSARNATSKPTLSLEAGPAMPGGSDAQTLQGTAKAVGGRGAGGGDEGARTAEAVQAELRRRRARALEVS